MNNDNNEMNQLAQELATLLSVKPHDLGYITTTQLKLSKSGLQMIISRLLTLGDYVTGFGQVH